MNAVRIDAVRLNVEIDQFPLREPFRIAGHTFATSDVVTVTLEKDGRTGRGEASGVFYLNDDVTGMVRRLESVRGSIERGIDRESLQRLLPVGGARNAVDCALWDLEAKLTNRTAWQMAGLNRPCPLLSTFTVSANDPFKMAGDARSFAHAKALKLKLTGDSEDADRLYMVRAARPDVSLTIDANQSFTRAFLEALMPVLLQTNVQLIEQPFAVGQENELEDVRSPIPIGADESAQGVADLRALLGRFQVVNIKLDKCGGLTEGLAMAREARRLGLNVMVGNMVGSSLAMAPASLVAQLCQVVDLDGPVFLSRDRTPAVQYESGMLLVPEALWGSPVVDKRPC